MDIYESDYDLDDLTVPDAFIIACSLVNNEMPVPVDLISKLHAAGVYIAH